LPTRRQRRLMDPAFAQAGLRAVFPMMRQACDVKNAKQKTVQY